MHLLSIAAIVGIEVIGTLVHYVYSAYKRSIKPSKFMLAAKEMGFIGYDMADGKHISMEQQQEALLRIFHLAGYFTLSNIWRDLNCIKFDEHIEEIFNETSAVIQYANADQPDPKKFNAKYLRKNLFNSDYLDVQDALDLILYIAQHAFNRQAGQERYELVVSSWMDIHENEYRETAQLLGLIDRRYPLLNEYDSAWIAGASRLGLSRRLLDFNYQIITRNIKIKGEILVLAGERELWANMDGISPVMSKIFDNVYQQTMDIEHTLTLLTTDEDDAIIDEGKSYLIYLADVYNIKLNTSMPFIHYETKAECPVNRYPNRIYANYAIDEKSKLTETLMARDLLSTFLRNLSSEIRIIDTSLHNDNRPNTTSTARDAAERLVQRILAGDYGKRKNLVVLLSSNNPYIERQTIATQRQVDEILVEFGLEQQSYHVKVEGFGFSSSQPLAIVHSELGALIAEKWKSAVAKIERSYGLKPKHDVKTLLYQTRDRHIVVEDPPTVKHNGKHGNFIKNWFDSYLI